MSSVDRTLSRLQKEVRFLLSQSERIFLPQGVTAPERFSEQVLAWKRSHKVQQEANILAALTGNSGGGNKNQDAVHDHADPTRNLADRGLLDQHFPGSSGIGTPSDLHHHETAANVEQLLHLVNYRDKVLSAILYAQLYRYAVLLWDLRVEVEFSDNTMNELREGLSAHHSKHGTVLDAYPQVALPSFGTAEEVATSSSALPSFPSYLVSLLKETENLDTHLRTQHLGKATQIERHSVACADLRREAAHFFRKSEALETELQELKAKHMLVSKSGGDDGRGGGGGSSSRIHQSSDCSRFQLRFRASRRTDERTVSTGCQRKRRFSSRISGGKGALARPFPSEAGIDD
ncbi:unnamed protein product [Amoebophrya sp. A25]|nr:unnamed protein product [Amoebophrya sp. A25]|eukprot:GSA25T00003692001.1